MKKNLLKGMIGCLYAAVIFFTSGAKAQNINPSDGVNFVGSINGYSQPINGSNDYRVLKYRRISVPSGTPTDGRGQWATTVNVQSSGGNVTPANMAGGGGNGFLLTSGGGAGNSGNFFNKWNFGGVGSGAVDAVNGVQWVTSGGQDMGLNMSATGRYTFVFKDAGYAGSGFYVGFTTNAPITMTHNQSTQRTVTSGIANLTATLSATPSSQENFYVRYRTVTNDFSSTNNVVQASVTGTTMSATIPAQPNTTVYYYIFSSTRSLSQIISGPAADIAYQALNYADNTGNNYSYVVPPAPNQPSLISGNATVCSGSSQTYSVTNDLAATSYSWTLPVGWTGTSTTNSITVTAGSGSGNISVTAVNSGGTSPVRTLAVSAFASTTYYDDSDNDTFGDPALPIISCSGQPAGTSTNNTDCDPSDSTKWRTGNFYVDGDDDGYYNGDPTTTAICYGLTAPSGYVASIIGTDCDDSNDEANPNRVEIQGNGTDDNCDGNIDEEGVESSIVPSQCGSTLTNISNTIYATQPTTATAYRFEVTNGDTVRTYDSPTNSFSLSNLNGGGTYGMTYTVRVAVKTSGFWRSYSSTCSITAPSAPETTSVIASQCGTTLANIATTIYVNQVTAANQYRFEVGDGVGLPRTYESSVNRFSLSNLSGGGAFGVTYSVRVALRFGATFEPYGPACNISTPSTPGSTSLQASQCNATISNRWTTIYANQVPSAQGYRFRVTNGATVRFVDRAVSNFALAQIGGAPLTPNTAYTVEVAVLYNSVYGAYGPACTLTTASVITRHAEAPIAVFDVKTYPNPFMRTFKLDVNTSNESNISLKVYDMIGRLVESREINNTELGSVELGADYSSGVYNVILSQDQNVKTLRMIKR